MIPVWYDESMSSLIILGLFAAVPVVLLFILRSNAAVAFLAVCAGTVLLRFVGGDASLVLSSLLPRASLVNQVVLNLVLLLGPALATTILLRKSMSGAKAIYNLFPAVAVGGLVALSAVPLLSPITGDNIMTTAAWQQLEQFQGLLVGYGVLMSLLLVKPSHKKSSKDHGKSHK